MAEKDIKKERKEIKQEEKPKPSIFGKWKKLAVGGLIGLSMLMPMKKAEGYVFLHNLTPPTGETAKRIEKKYPEGWGYVLKSDKLLDNGYTNGLTDKSITYFKEKYEKTKDGDALYMYAYSYYQRAIDSDNIEEVDYYLQKTLELCNKEVKDKKTKIRILGIKYFTLYNLSEALWREYKKDCLNVSYKEKAKKYLNSVLKDYKSNKNIFDQEDQEFFENDGPIKHSYDLLNRINEYQE